MSGIHIESIRKSFSGFVALKSVSLEIHSEEMTILLGPSGCGKTTLLRIIAGLETPDSGKIWIGDRLVNGLPPGKRNIAMVFQNYAIFPHMKVFENIAFGLKMKKTVPSLIKEKVEESARLMQIQTQLEKYPSQLSGGQRQRVAVARALAMD